MRVNKLIKEDFEYDKPSINPESLVIEDIIVESGDITEGSFKIISQGILTGMIYSPTKEFILESQHFNGKEITIKYIFDASYINKKGTIESYLQLITNSGEYMIPYRVIIKEPYINTSIGLINDLYEFTDLARKHWSEAVTLFTNARFEIIFLKNNTNLIYLYRLLIRNTSIDNGLDEFLQEINKKVPSSIRINKTQASYSLLDKPLKDYLSIEREGWGYLNIIVSTDSPFISINKSKISSDDFLGNIYELEYILDPNKMYYGNNYAGIKIETHDLSYFYNIVVKKSKPISISLDKISYTIDDTGSIIINNPNQLEIELTVEELNNQILFEQIYVHSSEDIIIPFTFKKQTFLDRLKSNYINKKLVTSANFTLHIVTDTYSEISDMNINISLQNFA